MNCPKCGGKTKVKDSKSEYGTVAETYRQRVCKDCGYFFTTAEKLLDSVVVADKLSEIRKRNRINNWCEMYDDCEKCPFEDTGKCLVLQGEQR